MTAAFQLAVALITSTTLSIFIENTSVQGFIVTTFISF